VVAALGFHHFTRVGIGINLDLAGTTTPRLDRTHRLRIQDIQHRLQAEPVSFRSALSLFSNSISCFN